MPHVGLGILVAVASVTVAMAIVEVPTSDCESTQSARERICGSQSNEYPSQLSACYIKVNRDYANCTKRVADILN